MSSTRPPQIVPAAGRTTKTEPQQSTNVFVPKLEIVLETEAGTPSQVRAVIEEPFFRLGSHPSNDMVVEDGLVSRFHCAIRRHESAWQVTDLGSLNGTYLNGVRVRDADVHLPECRLRIGDSSILLRDLGTVRESELPGGVNFGTLYGVSVPIRRLFGLVQRVAPSASDVLIEGESGTGKELIATEIVRRSPRASKPLVAVDCGAISPTLIESELFGHMKGAFTGALRDRQGAFEAADGGTIFLDEIGELPLEMQPKLLRVLATREVKRVGDHKPRRFDVRVIAATNRVLEREVNAGRFREDLYYRLSVVTLRVPPLRERMDDVKLLLDAFTADLDFAEKDRTFPAPVIEEMMRRAWPGNVRELKNYVERRVILGSDGLRLLEEPPVPANEQVDVDIDKSFRDAKEASVTAFERSYLGALMKWADGNVSRAARKANMDRMYLHRLLQRYQLRRASALDD